MKAGLHEEAISFLDKALESDPCNENARIHKAYCKLKMGDLKGAELDIDLSLNRLPEYHHPLFVKHEVCKALGKTCEAREFLEKAKKIAREKGPFQVLFIHLF